MLHLREHQYDKDHSVWKWTIKQRADIECSRDENAKIVEWRVDKIRNLYKNGCLGIASIIGKIGENRFGPRFKI